ncbi:hypothetical protein GDO81_020787 [Engystomops pustulosus]|uniref:Uncharacterized protein n=1 Tax=Engystomops pustulosus TaxID=76066 RepID=A0AAV6YQZ3_ENGPU|nr:hypothetical protein GDO81_020787 [Engystomops pustulosus]
MDEGGGAGGGGSRLLFGLVIGGVMGLEVLTSIFELLAGELRGLADNASPSLSSIIIIVFESFFASLGPLEGGGIKTPPLRTSLMVIGGVWRLCSFISGAAVLRTLLIVIGGVRRLLSFISVGATLRMLLMVIGGVCGLVSFTSGGGVFFESWRPPTIARDEGRPDLGVVSVMYEPW